jgi:hypothetical protein
MALSIRFEPRPGIVIATASGVLALEDAKSGAREVWDNPELRGKPIVWDLRSARLAVLPAEVRQLAEFILEGQPPDHRPAVAFVTGRDADFGMVRMFEVFREKPSTVVQGFRDLDKAISWARSMVTVRKP